MATRRGEEVAMLTEDKHRVGLSSKANVRVRHRPFSEHSTSENPQLLGPQISKFGLLARPASIADAARSESVDACLAEGTRR